MFNYVTQRSCYLVTIILTATTCPRTDSIDLTGDLSISFRVTSAEAGGLAITCAAFSISDGTVMGPILDTLDLDVIVMELSALIIVLNSMADFPCS